MKAKMRTTHIIVILLLTIVVVGCRVTPTTTPNPTATSLQKQPEPNRPLILGQISGVFDDTLITIHVQTLKGWEARSITRQGDGIWESIVTDASGIDYIVTAEAYGYTSVPISYTIHLEGMTAYMVEDGQITTKEAVHLDFHFNPIATTTPIK
jgi:hypothetical protein